jgi:hypothetical protein
MRAREKPRSHSGKRSTVVLVLAALVALGGLGPAAAGAKKKGKAPATTRTAFTGLAAGGTATATAACPGKTHASGGGFAVSPNFVPPNTGLSSWTTTSFPSQNKAWTAAGSAFTNPGASGSFTTFARCESNTLGRIALRASSSGTLSPGQFQTFTFNCPPGTHVISGGYAGDGPTDLGHPNGWRIDVLQSQRTAKGQWTISTFDRASTPPPSAPATLTGYVVCERDAKGLRVGEVAASAPIADNARVAADPTCPKKQHVISGGFLISPLPAGVGAQVPIISLDEFRPVGRRTWHAGLYEWVAAGLPPGKSLQAIAYCKRDSAPKK